MREAFKTSRRFLSGPAWSDYIVKPLQLGGEPTDDEIDAYFRQATGSIYHPIGTAAMTAENAGFGVVNPDFRVKGVCGLRIVDASIFVSSLLCDWINIDRMVVAVHPEWHHSGTCLCSRRAGRGRY